MFSQFLLAYYINTYGIRHLSLFLNISFDADTLSFDELSGSDAKVSGRFVGVNICFDADTMSFVKVSGRFDEVNNRFDELSGSNVRVSGTDVKVSGRSVGVNIRFDADILSFVEVSGSC
jgi:hypothetical protein